MKLDDGSELICTLALPLPLDLIGAVGEAIHEAVVRAGYTDAALLTDGSNRVVARKAEQP